MTETADTRKVGRRRLGPRGWAVIVGGVLSVVIVALGSALMLWRARETTIQEWKINLSNMSSTLAESTHQAMKAADLVLKSISERVEAADISTDEQLRREMGTAEIFEMLRNKASSVPQVDVATIVALNGDVINFTRSHPPPKINLSDRDYYKAHMADQKLDVYLSAPVRNRGTGTWTFYLARKIRSRTGETLGLVLTGIESEFFQDFFKAVNIGDKSAISLFRSDGILLAREPTREGLIGTSFSGQTVFREIIGRGSETGAVVATTPRLGDAWKSEMRIVAPRLLKDYPLVVNVTATEKLILELWYTTAWSVGIGAALFGLLLISLTAWIAALLSRQEANMADLKRARVDAEAAAQAKAEFLAMMSHEIRTPMNAMIGMLSLLTETPLGPTQKRYFRIIEDSAKRLLEIINDILDFSRLEAGRSTIENVDFDVRALAESAIEIARGLPGAASLDISTAFADNIPTVLVGDGDRLNQVLLNLLGNAVKYTERGAITLSATIVEQNPDTVRVRFSVTDTGVGIAPEIQTRLFRSFEQGDKQLARRKGGTGLGLAICKQVIDRNGGKIGVQSEPGHGSTFWFELPFGKAADAFAQAKAKAPEAVPALTGHSLRVLVAEDTPANQIVARAMLEKLGHRVQIVADGIEAVEAARTSVFDLVFMDIQMPNMDGYEAARRIRLLDGPAAKTPIIALTAFAQVADREKAIAAGMTDYLSKPIRVADLAAVIGRNVAPETGNRRDDMAGAELDDAVFAELSETLGEEAFGRLVDSFLNDAARFLDEFSVALAANHSSRIRATAHRLAGLFGQFGASRAAAAALAVELAKDDELLGSRSDELLARGRAAIAAVGASPCRSCGSRKSHPAASAR